MSHLAKRKGEDGASAVEYGLLVVAIAAVIAILVFTLGDIVLHGMFEKTCTNIKNQGSLSASCTP
jgi:pilus assembly protein Flp/PilA